MADFLHIGDTVDYTPGSAVTGGDVVVQGELVAVATQDIAANAKGALRAKGVFIFPKGVGSSDALTAGAKVYWDAVNEVVTTNAAGGTNKYVGKVVEAAAAATATVRVRLEQ